ncbi:Uncharacterised protein [Moraxella lacunata]|uniref:Uncharacterized protein n=1 Tax=Moraxella lacunata TaxID=477 RepID=A0A378TS87_MORLA|nr:Uncharacterised protein [Moraxella lacunata]
MENNKPYKIFHDLTNFFHLFFYIYPPKWGIIFHQISMQNSDILALRCRVLLILSSLDLPFCFLANNEKPPECRKFFNLFK